MYELVTKGELEKLRSTDRLSRVVHVDILAALTHMKSMAIGEGMRVDAPGNNRDVDKRRKSAIHLAMRMKMPIDTFAREGWLYIEKVHDWPPKRRATKQDKKK